MTNTHTNPNNKAFGLYDHRYKKFISYSNNIKVLRHKAEKLNLLHGDNMMQIRDMRFI